MNHQSDAPVCLLESHIYNQADGHATRMLGRPKLQGRPLPRHHAGAWSQHKHPRQHNIIGGRSNLDGFPWLLDGGMHSQTEDLLCDAVKNLQPKTFVTMTSLSLKHSCLLLTLMQTLRKLYKAVQISPPIKNQISSKSYATMNHYPSANVEIGRANLWLSKS